MQKMRYQNLAAAVGAFVAAEFEACQCEPSRLMLDTEFAPDLQAGQFDAVRFEEHLSGMLSDLVDLCTVVPANDPYQYRGPVALVVARTDELWQQNPDGSHKAIHDEARTFEWQMCAQGYARIEACN